MTIFGYTFGEWVVIAACGIGFGGMILIVAFAWCVVLSATVGRLLP